MTDVQLQDVTTFVSPSGRAFVFIHQPPYHDGDAAFSPDGETFHALASKGVACTTSAGVVVELGFSFEEPFNGLRGELRYDGTVIEHDGEVYVERQASSIRVVPLPPTRRLEYFCRTEDGTMVYVSVNRYNYSYDSFKLFIGDGKRMREVHVDRVERLRDGGTTHIYTSEETFYAPSPYVTAEDPTRGPLWGAQRLTRLNPDDYDITEADDQVVIRKR